MYKIYKTNLKVTGTREKKYIEASTIKSKLLSVSTLRKFLNNRCVFINIKVPELSHLISECQELCASLKLHITQREKIVSKFKSESLITTEQFQKYGSSEHVQKINEILKYVAENSGRRKQRRSKQQSIDIRDYLMVTLMYFNCLRASNLMNISLDDVSKIKKHEEIDGAWVLTNDVYKTSMI